MNLNNFWLFKRYPLAQQLLYFGLVGTCAAIVQMLTVVGLVESYGLHPLTANIAGFFLAFHVSYWGHHQFTFPTRDERKHSATMGKLWLVASTGFIANEGLFYIFLNPLKLYYPLALLLTLIIFPAITFLLGKFWIYR